MNIAILPILKDNYAYILTDGSGSAAVIDPGDAAPVIDFLEKSNLKLSYILNTHHHGDHTAGNRALQQRYRASIVAPAREAGKIDGVDVAVTAETGWRWDAIAVRVLETPGHTLGWACYYIPAEKALFTGDTLFSLGCGRLFEGTAAQMWQSLTAIMALPDDTQIYCGHEYTLSNAKFCLHVEPDNADLKARVAEAEALRAQNRPTLPVSLAREKKTNVFLRAESAARFAELRAMKDRF